MAQLRRTVLALVLGLVAVLAAGGCAAPAQHWTAPPEAPGAGTAPVRALTRLVLLPPVYEVDGSVPARWSAVSESARLRAATVRFLVDWKGYRVDTADARATATGLTADALRSALLAHQRAQPAPGARLPADLAARVREFAALQQADGVVVLGVMHLDLNPERWAVIYGTALFTLGVGQWFYLDSLGTYTDAAIYDGRSGAPLWWARHQAATAGNPSPADDVPRFAFDALPTALPGAPGSVPATDTR